jgi:hypothetical protein
VALCIFYPAAGYFGDARPAFHPKNLGESPDKALFRPARPKITADLSQLWAHQAQHNHAQLEFSKPNTVRGLFLKAFSPHLAIENGGVGQLYWEERRTTKISDFDLYFISQPDIIQVNARSWLDLVRLNAHNSAQE